MNLPAVAPSRKDLRRKRLFIIAAGAAVTVAIIYIAAVAYLSASTPWNKKAIISQYAGLTIQKFGPASGASIDLIYKYRIHNSGKYDYWRFALTLRRTNGKYPVPIQLGILCDDKAGNESQPSADSWVDWVTLGGNG